MSRNDDVAKMALMLVAFRGMTFSEGLAEAERRVPLETPTDSEAERAGRTSGTESPT